MTTRNLYETIQTSFEIWLENFHRSLHDAEKVVEVLLDHYQKGGSKFVYCQSNAYSISPVRALVFMLSF